MLVVTQTVRNVESKNAYDVVTLRHIYGHVTYTGYIGNPNDTTTNGVSNYTKSYTVDVLKNPS